MKKLLALIVFITAITFAQTNAISSFKTYDNGSSFVVDVTFTLDSTAGMATNSFKLPEAVYDFKAEGIPVTFFKKTVSTYGTPYMSAYLQGVYQSQTDTVSLDTLSNLGMTESDTLGQLTLNSWRAPSYKLYLRNLNCDINSGKIVLVFPKKDWIKD